MVETDQRKSTFLIERFDGECWTSTGYAYSERLKALAHVSRLRGTKEKFRISEVKS